MVIKKDKIRQVKDLSKKIEGTEFLVCATCEKCIKNIDIMYFAKTYGVSFTFIKKFSLKFLPVDIESNEDCFYYLISGTRSAISSCLDEVDATIDFYINGMLVPRPVARIALSLKDDQMFLIPMIVYREMVKSTMRTISEFDKLLKT